MNNSNNKKNVTNVIASIFIVVSFGFFFFTIYKHFFTHHENTNFYYIKYYIFSFLSIIFWYFFKNFTDEVKKNILTVTISIIIGVYIFDLIISSYYYLNKNKISSAYDNRNAYQVYKDMKEKGVDILPSYSPHNFLKTNGIEDADNLFPLSLVSHQYTLLCNEDGTWHSYTTDRYGFNNPDDVWDQEKIDWLFVGDSFTLGSCVLPENNIMGNIRKITNSPSVINLGMGGNGPLIELATLKEYIVNKRLKNVFWMYFEGNDLSHNELVLEKRNTTLTSYLKTGFSQNLVAKQEIIDKSLKEIISRNIIEYKKVHERKFYEKFIKWVRLDISRGLIQKFLKNDTQNREYYFDPLFEKILLTARDTIKSNGGELFFVYLPEFYRYNKSSINHKDFRNRQKIINMVKANNIKLIDIHEKVFLNHKDPLSLFPFRKNGHYTKEGYKIVAQKIYGFIKKLEIK